MANLSAPTGDKTKCGRPSAYSEERAKRIIADVRKGNHLTTAARLAGINPRTLLRWMERGAADEAAGLDTHWAALARELDAASAEAEARVAGVFAAGDGAKEAWRAAEAFLVRRFPERWAVTRQLTDHAQLGIDLDNATREELEHALAAFEAAASAVRQRLEAMG